MRLRKKCFLATITIQSLICAVQPIHAEGPPRPTTAQIEQLHIDGDRFADQGDYKAALEKYTEAAHGVVTKIRGQRFNDRVLPNIMTRKELGEEMLRLMNAEYDEDELLLMDSTYKVFGLIPVEMSTQKMMTALLTEEVAGFYDPDTKRMVMIVEEGSKDDPGWLGRLLGAKAAFDKDEQKTTLAHEMTHALQDQLYDLNKLEAGIQKDDDMLLAFSALVEGDATLLMFADMDSGEDITQSDPEEMRAVFNIMSWMLPLAGGKTYRSAPPIFRESLIFPYFQGMLFNLSLAGKGGWKSVHETYTRPPTSTEQILHPRKYVQGDNFDAPQSVTIPSLTSTLGDRWRQLGGNCLGELQTSIMLKSIAGGTRAAEGWDGDRYEVFSREDQKLGLVSVSIWDSEQDAQEFAEAFRKYRNSARHLTTRTKRAAVVDDQANDQSTTQDAAPDSKPQQTTRESLVCAADAVNEVILDGEHVWVLDGFTAEENERIKTLLKNCEFAEKSFPLPEKE